MNGRHIFGWLWNIFKNSLGALKQKTEVVGKDHLGNTYYEKFADPTRNLKGARWVETDHGDQFVAPDIPVEWEAWLRKKRDIAPTEEEIAQNYAIMQRTLRRAKESEEKLKKLADGSEEETVKKHFQEDTTADISTKFPEYPEYEIIPGKKKDEK